MVRVNGPIHVASLEVNIRTNLVKITNGEGLKFVLHFEKLYYENTQIPVPEEFSKNFSLAEENNIVFEYDEERGAVKLYNYV